MILGINATKEAIFVAETHGAGQQFSVAKIQRIKFQIGKATDLADLLSNIATLLNRHTSDSGVSASVLKCFGGQYGSSVEAIKAEAISELAAVQNGLSVKEVTPQSLKKALNCIAGEKWQECVKRMFNSDNRHNYWSQGANGAVAAAFKAAAE